eukprot:CAMPEP_0115127770 /NCGR_PEP_ID=MMETSP0227-20121206/50632_1 /TAXON_ID=89957 /ORGANISM="Polarella glacialis, Strain CCMP 1383" /LENGTH=1068 /DNA_ID=CAMNT_0002531989 /DNA_START=71 /DNA_END=3275 /DNA_ORIENTATION=-
MISRQREETPKSSRAPSPEKQDRSPKSPANARRSTTIARERSGTVNTIATSCFDDDKAQDEDYKEEHAAVDEETMQYVGQSFRDMMESDVSQIRSTILVDIFVTSQDRLGLIIDWVKIDDSKPFERPYPATIVSGVEKGGLVDLWNEQQLPEAKQVLCSEDVCLRIHSVNSEPGAEGVKLIQGCLDWLRKGHPGKARLQIGFEREASFSFRYKGRKCRGTAVHIAALHQDGPQLLRHLLDGSVDIHQECGFITQGVNGSFHALHLAAGRGNVRMIDMLLDEGVDVNVKTKQKGNDHYTALHEAAFFQKLQAVKKLIERGADLNATNLKLLTPLHIAATQGNALIAKRLIVAKAKPKVKDDKGSTPLMSAIESGRYPYKRLWFLTEQTFSDLLQVAHLSPSAASDLLRDSKTGYVVKSWADKLMDKSGPTERSDFVQSKFIRLYRLAPRAGEDIIEALTAEPKVTNDNHHPLPRRARLPLGMDFICEYRPATSWEFDTENSKNHPEWHKSLCPRKDDDVMKWHLFNMMLQFDPRVLPLLLGRVPRIAGRKRSTGSTLSSYQLEMEVHNGGITSNLVPVQVVCLKLPGVICPKVFHALCETKEHRIFTKVAVRAAIDFTWRNLVIYNYFAKFLLRVVLSLILMYWCLDRPQNQIVRRACWSWIAMFAHLELFHEFFEMRGYFLILRDSAAYFGQAKNLFDYASIALLLGLVYLTANGLHLEDWPMLLAVIVLCRWFQLTWTTRAFAWAGQKILPILQASFRPMGGIMLVTSFVFAGFLHAFSALSLAAGDVDQYQVLLGTVRLLLLGDGDGVDTVLGLYDGNNTGNWITFCFLSVAVIWFCICMLNLFIAVHSEAYDQAQEKAQTCFLQERTAICLHFMLMPSWPPPGWGSKFHLHRPVLVSLLINAVFLVVWAAVVTVEEIPTFVPAAVLLAGMILSGAVLAQPPWDQDTIDQHYLWICHRADYDESLFGTPESDERGNSRIAALKFQGKAQQKGLAENLDMVKQKVSDQTSGISYKMQSVMHRLDDLESYIQNVTTNLQSMTPSFLSDASDLQCFIFLPETGNWVIKP